MRKALFTIVPKGYVGIIRFITPYYPPLGIGYLAAVVEKLGWNVSICDRTHESERDLLAAASREKPDLIGVSAVMPLLEPALDQARKLRQASPGSLIVVGGPLASCQGEKLVGPDGFDAAVCGEGEHVIGHIADVASAGPGVRSKLADIPGVFTHEGGKVRACPACPPTQDLDTIPFPARHLFSLKSLYLRHPTVPRHIKGTAILTSRGCPYRCSFCYRYPFKDRYRTHSPGYVIEEMLLLRRKYDIRNIRFHDDTLTFDRERIMRLCEAMISRVPGMTWDCTTRVDLVDPEMLGLMKRSGCRSIYFGIESGSPGDLGKMLKELASEVRPALDACVAAGIKPAGHFILGFPWDTPESIRERVRFARKLPLDFAFFWPFMPWPGTPIYDEMANPGSDPVYSPPGFKHRDMELMTLKANISVNLRPGRIASLLASRTAFGT